MSEKKQSEIQNLEKANQEKADQGVIENLDLLLDMEMLQEDPDLEMFGNLNEFQTDKK